MRSSNCWARSQGDASNSHEANDSMLTDSSLNSLNKTDRSNRFLEEKLHVFSYETGIMHLVSALVVTTGLIIHRIGPYYLIELGREQRKQQNALQSIATGGLPLPMVASNATTTALRPTWTTIHDLVTHDQCFMDEHWDKFITNLACGFSSVAYAVAGYQVICSARVWNLYRALAAVSASHFATAASHFMLVFSVYKAVNCVSYWPEFLLSCVWAVVSLYEIAIGLLGTFQCFRAFRAARQRDRRRLRKPVLFRRPSDEGSTLVTEQIMTTV